MIQDERTTAVGNLNANDPTFWQEPIHTTTRNTAFFESRGLARRVVHRLQLQNHPLFNGSAPKRQGIGIMIADARRKISSTVRRVLRRQPDAPVEPPNPDEGAAESGIISQFLAGVARRAGAENAAGGDRLRVFRSAVCGACRQHAGRRVHGAESRASPRRRIRRTCAG